MVKYYISKNTGKCVHKNLLKVDIKKDNTMITHILSWEYNNLSLPCRVKKYKAKLKEINMNIFNEINQEHYDRLIKYLEDNAIGY